MSIDIKVKEIIAQHLGFNVSEITDKDTLIKNLGADSIDIAELSIKFEVEFDIRFTEEEDNTFWIKNPNIVEIIEFIKDKSRDCN